MLSLFIRRYILILLIVVPSISFAQHDDFGVWASLNTRKKFDNDLRISFGTESRLFNNASQLDKQNYDLGVAYKLTDIFSVSTGYRFGAQYHSHENTDYSHRMHLDLSLEKESSRYEMKFRIRWQSKWSDLYQEDNPAFPANFLRSKLGVSYKIFGSRFRPNFSVEAYSPVEKEDGARTMLSKLRTAIGTDIKLTKHISAEVFYMLQTEYGGKVLNRDFILGTGLSYDF